MDLNCGGDNFEMVNLSLVGLERNLTCEFVFETALFFKNLFETVEA